MKNFITLSAVVLAVGLAACNPDADPIQKSDSSSATKAASTDAAVNWPYTLNGMEQDTLTLDQNPTRDVYVVVLDMSGSMDDSVCAGNYTNKAEAAKAALDQWSQAIDPEAKLGLVVFDRNGISTWVEPGVNNVANFRSQLAKASPDGGTPLASSVKQAYVELTRAGMEQQGYGTYRMVIVTDGEASSGQDPRNNVEWLSLNTPIEVHTIGFCIDEGHSLNQPGITEYATADNPEALITGLKAVLAESTTYDISTFSND